MRTYTYEKFKAFENGLEKQRIRYIRIYTPIYILLVITSTLISTTDLVNLTISILLYLLILVGTNILREQKLMNYKLNIDLEDNYLPKD